MQFLLSIILSVLMSVSQGAVAGFKEITGKAQGTLEYGDPFPPFEHQLQIEANANARKQCRHWMPIYQISPYLVRWDQIPYWGYQIYLQADYLCGESDY